MRRKYPHQILFHHIHKKGLDKIAYIMIGLGVLTIVPQIIQIYQTQSAEDISLISWAGYTAIGVFWLWYGIERKVKPIVVSAILGLIVKAIMINGIMQFGTVKFF